MCFLSHSQPMLIGINMVLYKTDRRTQRFCRYFTKNVTMKIKLGELGIQTCHFLEMWPVKKCYIGHKNIRQLDKNSSFLIKN